MKQAFSLIMKKQLPFIVAGILMIALVWIFVWSLVEQVSYLYPGPSMAIAGVIIVLLFTFGFLNRLVEHNRVHEETLKDLQSKNNEQEEKIKELKQQPRRLPKIQGFDHLIKRWFALGHDPGEDQGRLLFQQVQAVQQLLLQENIKTITFIRSLASNKPDRGAFLVRPDAQPTRVLKFDKVQNITLEQSCYDTYVRRHLADFTPGDPIYHWPGNGNQMGMSDSPGIIMYQLAQLQNNADSSQLQSLGEFYHYQAVADVLEALEHLVKIMAPRWLNQRSQTEAWWDAPRQQGNSLFDEYERLGRKVTQMEQGFRDALETLRKLDIDTQFDQTDVECCLRIGDIQCRLDFNPIAWVSRVFTYRSIFAEKLGEYDQPGQRIDTIVHGDFHSGNVLVETGSQNRLWLIDFPHVHIGPVFTDIARLEADLKFGLLPSTLLQPNFHTLQQLEEVLLGNGERRMLDLSESSRPLWRSTTLDWETEMDKLWQCLGYLRRFVRNSCFRSTDACPYYLALLHATLPVLYYRDRSPWQKLYAFISAAQLCYLIENKERVG